MDHVHGTALRGCTGVLIAPYVCLFSLLQIHLRSQPTLGLAYDFWLLRKSSYLLFVWVVNAIPFEHIASNSFCLLPKIPCFRCGVLSFSFRLHSCTIRQHWFRVLDDSSIHVSAPPPAAYRPWWACAISRLSLCTTPPLAARSFDNQDLIWPCSMGCLWFHECRAFPSPRPPARHEGAPVVASAGALFLGLADHSGMMSPDGPTRR